MSTPAPVRMLGAKAASKVRRTMLGALLRLPGASSAGSDPSALLSRFPEESLTPLRRTHLDPVPALVDREPVSRLKMPLGLRGWLVTGYDEAREVMAADHEVFSNDFSNMVGKAGIAADQDPGGLGFADPPAHTRLRHMLTSSFTVRALARRQPRIDTIVADAVAEVARLGAGGEPVDLLDHFAFPIASRTIMEILGVDEADGEAIRQLSVDRFDFSSHTTEGLSAIVEAVDHLVPVVAKQRREPRDGLIGQILADHGDDIGDLELAGLADGVLTGGLETTVSMLALGTLLLLQDRAAFDLIASGDRVEEIVEELLRYLSVVQVGFPRFARHDMRLGGKQLLAGDIVIVSLLAANRDPRKGEGLDRFDPRRADPSGQLAFAHGIHRCVGAELARMELRTAFPALVRAFPRLRLAIERDDLAYREASIVYGLRSLPVLVT